MKKLFRVLLIIIISAAALLLICLTGNDTTPYLSTGYYRETCRRADSLDRIAITLRDTLFAGFSRVSITPPLAESQETGADGQLKDIPLAGYGDRKGKPATGVHDSIFVKAIAIRETNRMIILIGADLLIMPSNIADSVVARLESEGIRREELFFTATHSHSSLGGWGPGYIGELFAGKENHLLEKWIEDRILKSVILAVADLKPAVVASGSFNASSYTRNRLVGEAGTKNDEFVFVSLMQAGGKKALLGSFSAHATTLGDDNMNISADYPGYWERSVEKNGFDYAVFSAGSVGSQSPVGKGEKFEKAAYIGNSLADSTLSHLKLCLPVADPLFSASSLKIALPEYRIRITTKLNLRSCLSKRLLQEPANVYIQAFRLGDLVWITAPGDFSGEFAREIKNELASEGFKSNISSFNGSYVGYIIPGKYYYLNEYESVMMGWFGPFMGDYIVDMMGRLTKTVLK